MTDTMVVHFLSMTDMALTLDQKTVAGGSDDVLEVRRVTNYDTNSSASAVESGAMKEPHCSSGDLLGAFGLFVQGLLAFLAFTCLIVKRYCEPKHSRRPWKIWFFDTSKQALGAAVIHFANVFLADMFHGDPCTWYFISFLLDSTVGLLIIYLGLKLTQVLAHRYACKSLFFGEYGEPPQCNAWVGQTALYIIVMIVEKLLMTFLVLPSFWVKVRKFIMSPIKDPMLELALVMFIVPLIVNAILFWVVDNFLKRSIRQSKTIYVNCQEPRVKYFRNTDQVKCYKRIEKGEESDAQSAEEDGDTRSRHNDPSERLIAAK
ncbi:store-operated calcium entry regulator STIMATE-like [Babylonia areolata]|uniref:store-operated calcium entry regulator STIMATE-like n=1 Tax=Babylonia areolata TaxID=304850 RepID=UPI003FD2FD1C